MLKSIFNEIKDKVMSSPEDIFKDKQAVALGKAVRKGDIEKIKSLVAEGANPNFFADDGATSLVKWAILYGQRESFTTLLDVGADPTVCNIGGKPMLHVIAQANDIFYLQTLLERGVDPNSKNCKSGGNALPYAATEEHFLLLLDAGLDMDAQDNYGKTSLHRAPPGEVEILLKRGADPTIRDNRGKTFQRRFFSASERLLTQEGKERRKWLRAWLQERNIPLEEN